MTTLDRGRVDDPGEQATVSAAPGPTGLTRLLAEDLRWAFTPPCTWLLGVVANLALSLLYLAVVPLTGGHHRDWAILVGSYFAVFVLADVTTTNVLGVDTERTRLRLLRGVPLLRILLAKNLALLVVVGLPTLLATAAITLHSESGWRLELTLPGVLFPVLTWLGVGNLISVLLPVAPVRLRTRWQERRVLRRTGRWLGCLVLPYVLCLAVDPVRLLPRLVTRTLRLSPGVGVRGLVLLGVGLVLWTLSSSVAVAAARRRSIPFDDLR